MNSEKKILEAMASLDRENYLELSEVDEGEPTDLMN